ncbi:MAG: lipid-A-disaccharide synthase [Bacteroidetes bacterium]|nr:lipid-A-disaccharide synthase [Bacteroidota bacterium]MBV6460956.1 Lipid-A-disaccharide synthase [Flavobacteriales bacterium]WKZ75645.1 MAG: lipid-A-disaccharide synthase [Vicingaceae bacterium]MCL4815211.1 lipid-A-disaccharide synthase [Flavobacteriales bacterium]NOG94553.1 lipid-A-disaccharide synthase [Bacteroidota bacterium]
MRYYIIAGEASGDLHAANLLKEIKKIDSSAHFRCWGGDLMQQQGAELVKHYKDLAFMGFTEVLLNINTIFKNLSNCKTDILQYAPDVLILVDYPGFNLRIAEFAKQKGIKVFYYISPQVWAWKQSRVHKIKKVVDKMFVILPFEKEFYARFNYQVDFVGHPLLDAINLLEKKSFTEFCSENNLLVEKPIIALLPGSRKQEINAMLPEMLTACKHFKNYQFVIAAAPSQPPELYNTFVNESTKVLFGKTYALLQQATAALVTSGTATLETALFEVPEVVCYKGSNISYQIAKQLIKVKYISLVNLILDKPVVQELIQDDFNEKQIAKELKEILPGMPKRELMKNDFALLKQKLGGKGASEKTAKLMWQYLSC